MRPRGGRDGGLERAVERRVRQPVVAQRECGLANGHHFGVRRRVERGDGRVAALGDDLSARDDHAADRRLACFFGLTRELKRSLHPSGVIASGVIRLWVRGVHSVRPSIKWTENLWPNWKFTPKSRAGIRLGRSAYCMLFAVFLAVVTIVSHRAHTDAEFFKSDANDKWSYFQSKRIKFHSLELGEDLLKSISNPTPEAEATLARYEKEKKRYDHDSDVAQEDARKMDEKSEHVEAEALRFDFGEGLLEIGLVLTSLYFISRSKLFPAVGLISALIGLAMAISGYLICLVSALLAATCSSSGSAQQYQGSVR